MARNRKNGHEGSRMVFWGVALSVLGTVLAMAYLSLFNTCESIGRQIKKLEQERVEIHKRVVNEERNWEMARSIANMVRLMESYGIAMSWPEERNIIRLCKVAPDQPVSDAFPGGLARRD